MGVALALALALDQAAALAPAPTPTLAPAPALAPVLAPVLAPALALALAAQMSVQAQALTPLLPLHKNHLPIYLHLLPSRQSTLQSSNPSFIPLSFLPFFRTWTSQRG